MRSIAVMLLVPVIGILEAGSARAADDELACHFQLHFQIENDNEAFGAGLLFNTDELYTNGWRLAASFCGVASSELKSWTQRHMPFLGRHNEAEPPPGVKLPDSYEPSAVDTGIVVGQTIYTPKDLQVQDGQPNDRAYAGLAWVGATARLRTAREMLQLELDVMWIGPSAGGKEFQDAVHDTLGFKRARGWDNQLPDQPGIQLLARWDRRLWPAPVAADGKLHVRSAVYGHALGTAGTLRLHGGLGGTVRLGVGWERILPDELGLIAFGVPQTGLGPGLPWYEHLYRHLGLSFFAGTEGRLVGFNATIEGPLFGSVQQSELTHDQRVFVWDAEVGFTLSITRYFLLQWGQVWRGPEMVLPAGAPDEGIHGFREIQLLFSFGAG